MTRQGMLCLLSVLLIGAVDHAVAASDTQGIKRSKRPKHRKRQAHSLGRMGRSGRLGFSQELVYSLS